jgi:hypothetical protein
MLIEKEVEAIEWANLCLSSSSSPFLHLCSKVQQVHQFVEVEIHEEEDSSIGLHRAKIPMRLEYLTFIFFII